MLDTEAMTSSCGVGKIMAWRSSDFRIFYKQSSTVIMTVVCKLTLTSKTSLNDRKTPSGSVSAVKVGHQIEAVATRSKLRCSIKYYSSCLTLTSSRDNDENYDNQLEGKTS